MIKTGDQDYQLQLAIQNSMGFESQKGESEYVMDSEEEGDEDYHFQLAIQQSLGFESQNAEDGGNGVYDEPGFGAQTTEPFADNEMREATQEEIDLEAHLAAARNAQYAREDED